MVDSVVPRQNGELTEDDCSYARDFCHIRQSLSGDDGDLDRDPDANANQDLVTDVLARGVDVERIEETSANGGENCPNDEKWLKVADLANEDAA